MLATLMGIPHTTTAVRFTKENGKVLVERELEGGALQVVELTAPCLVTTQTGMNQVRYASLKGIMAAKKKPIDVKSVADLGLAGQVGEAAAKVKLEKLYTPAKGQGAEMLSARSTRSSASWSARSRSWGFSSPLEMSMGSILVVAEVQKGKVREASYELVSFARKIGAATGREVKSLVMGQGAQAHAERWRRRAAAKSFSPTTRRSPITISTRRSPR